MSTVLVHAVLETGDPGLVLNSWVEHHGDMKVHGDMKHNEKNPKVGCLMGMTDSYMGIIINHYKDPY